MSGSRGTGAVALLLMLAASTASATDGHFLHGVGAVNSAMGGAGVAVSSSLLGTYYLNPAGLMGFDGTRVEFGFEMFKADRSVASDIPGFGGGSTTSKKDWVPIPAMGISKRLNNDRMVLGLGAVGIGGFGVDYPASTTNPILTPQPNGFGQVYSNYSLLKIQPTVAVAVTPKFWLGGALNVDWASLAVMPMPVAAPACSGAPQPCYYPSAGAADGAFGFGFQLGARYNINDLISVGASYTSPQWFDEFEFNSTNANPNLPDFGAPITINFGLDVPAMWAAGVGVTPLPGLTLAADGRYITYESTTGFKESGFNADGSVAGFGWKNIWVIAVGGEYWIQEKFALRAGYNHSDNPISEEQSFFNVPAPAIMQSHLTLGAGVKIARRLQVDLGYYHVFEASVTGPIPNPALPPGSTVTNTMTEDAILLQFTVGAK